MKEGVMVNKKEVERLLNSALEEIEWSCNPHKDKATKEVYLSNAKRFITMAIEKIN